MGNLARDFIADYPFLVWAAGICGIAGLILLLISQFLRFRIAGIDPSGPAAIALAISWTILFLADTKLLKGTLADITGGQRPAATITFRDFVTRGHFEPDGLGLYSYLLFASRSDSNRPQRVAALKAYLHQFDVAKSTHGLAEKRQKNGFFVPTGAEAEWIDECERGSGLSDDPAKQPIAQWRCRFEGKGKRRILLEDELADWLEVNYDYQRASQVVANVQGALSLGPSLDGIYVASYTEPLLRNPDIHRETILWQDLSRLRPEQVDLWVQEVGFQFTKRDFWNVAFVRRTLLLIATRLPDVADLVSLAGNAEATELLKKLPR